MNNYVKSMTNFNLDDFINQRIEEISEERNQSWEEIMDSYNSDNLKLQDNKDENKQTTGDNQS